MPKLSRSLHASVASGGMTRREANHQQWEADQAAAAIKARVAAARVEAARKQRQAEDQARREANQRVTGSRRARNNRREY